MTLALTACGGGGGSEGSNQANPPAPVPNPVVYTHTADARTRQGVTLADGRWLLVHNITSASGGQYESAAVGLVLWDPATRTVAQAARLRLPASVLETELGLGVGGTGFYPYNLTDMRATADGGVVLQYDLFGANDASGNQSKIQVIARLGSDLGVRWARTWRSEQWGQLELRADRIVSTGRNVVSYSLDGAVISRHAYQSWGSVRLANQAVVIAGFGGYAAARDDGSLDAFSLTDASSFYAAVADGAGGAVLAGYVIDGGISRPGLARVGSDGLPGTKIQLDLPDSEDGLRDIDRLDDHYYAVGSRGPADASHWYVCKFAAATLQLVKCVQGTNGMRLTNMFVRADAGRGWLRVSNYTRDSRNALVLDRDLNRVFDNGETVSVMSATSSAYGGRWMAPVSGQLATASADEVNASLVSEPIALGTLHTGALASLLN